MRLNVRFSMDNAAFGETDEDRLAEAARILRDMANRLEARGLGQFALQDLNGNTVGEYHFSAINSRRSK